MANSTAAIENAAAIRKSGFIFRGDDRGHAVIFNEGFQPRGTNRDLLKYAESNVPSVYVTVQPLCDWLDRIASEGTLQDGEHAVALLA